MTPFRFSALMLFIAMPQCASSPTSDAGDAAVATDHSIADANASDASPNDDAVDDLAPDALSSDATDADLAPFDVAALFAPHNGGIAISQATIDVAGMTFALAVHTAGFSDLLADSGTVCNYRVDGACAVANCTLPPGTIPGADAGTTTRAPSAGVITISGGTMAPITLTPDPLGHYANATTMFQRWHDGDRVSIAAAGGDVPAFATELIFPPQVTIDQPTPPFGAIIAIDRATGLDIRWTGTGPRLMQVVIEQTVTRSDASTATHFVDCWYPISDLAATVAPAAIRDFESTMDGGTSSVGVIVSPVANATVTAGDYQITIQATPGGFIGTGYVL